MTDKEKLKDIRKLADAMYYAAQYLTTDASRLHKAMDEYHKFIIHEWREEPKPKFKVGDCIRPIDSCLGSQRTICEVCDGWYVTNQGTLDFEYEDNWELVEDSVHRTKAEVDAAMQDVEEKSKAFTDAHKGESAEEILAQMTNKEAIKYLQQLYPNGGHCWLDEQRIDAISIAINAIEFKDKVRAEIERRMNELYNKLPNGNEVINGAVTIPDANITGKYTALEGLLSFIDSMQEEEIPPKFPLISSKEELKQKPFKVEKGKLYVCIKDYHDKNCTFTKGKNYKSDKDGFLIDDEDKDTFERKIWEEDACEYFRPIKCIYTEYNYTDEDRRVLCDGCEEECEYAQKEEPVSEDFEEALAKEWKGYVDRGAATVDALEDNTQELTFAKGFYRGAKWQKAKNESTSKDLGEYINELSKQFPEVSFAKLSRIAVRVAKWQKEQFEKDYTDLCNGIVTAKGIAVAMAYDKGVAGAKEHIIKDATDVTVHIDAGGYPYIPQMELYDYDKDVPLAKAGDKYKVVLIRKD